MATLKYILQGNSGNTNIYVRFSNGRNNDFKRKTGYTINPKDWSFSKGEPNQKTAETKMLKNKLDNLSNSILNAYNSDIGLDISINGQWLQQKIDLFNNKVQIIDMDIISNYIQKYIDGAHLKINQHKQIGLSLNRVKNLNTFKNLFQKFETETSNGSKYLIKNVDLNFRNSILNWLISKGYSSNYQGKIIDNLITICRDAEQNGIIVSAQLKNIKSFTEKKQPNSIIYLTVEEQKKINETIFDCDRLNNAKKWLLLGCQIGQRGGDLLSITESNIKDNFGVKGIEVFQKKTQKFVTIPLNDDIYKIIKNGLPYKISLTKFNEYIKEICKKAEINDIIIGRKKSSSHGPTILTQRPKHSFISSHVCRRSFASNNYGKINTSFIKELTGHSTERMLLDYIGKSSNNLALELVDQWKKLSYL